MPNEEKPFILKVSKDEFNLLFPSRKNIYTDFNENDEVLSISIQSVNYIVCDSCNTDLLPSLR